MKIAAVFLICFALSACVVSEAPLSPLSPVSADSPLLGSWIQHDKETTVYLHIWNDTKSLMLLQVELSTDGPIKTERFSASSIRLNSNDYLSIELPVDGKIQYLLCKYRITQNHILTLWLPDTKYLSQVVSNGLLPGVAKLNTIIPSVLLSANEEALRQFVSKHAGKVFMGNEITFEREH